MRSPTTIPYLLRGAVVASLLALAAALLFGPADFKDEPQSAEAAFPNEVKKLIASDAQSHDVLGLGVAVSGDTAIAGAPNEDTGGEDAGAAYVFQRDEGGAGNWGEVKKLTASDAELDDKFGIAVAVNGDTAIAGAPADTDAEDAGTAYIFQRDEGGANNWGEVKKLTASDAELDDLFGAAVSISGDIAIVAAMFEDAAGINAGAVYVFERDEGGADNWGKVKKLTASDAEAGDEFGSGVAVSGDTVVVGALGEDAGGIIAGAAYVFGRNEGGAGNWGEVAKLTASDAQDLDTFGASVAVSGDIAVIGARYEDGAGASNSDFGAAYVFERDEGGADNWGEVTKLTASDAEGEDEFGYGVAVSGDIAIVGSQFEDAVAFSAGAAYVFRRDLGGASNWGELAKLTASDGEINDHLGVRVGISGATTIVAARGEDTGGSNAGAAYVSELDLTDDPTDVDGDGCSDAREKGSDETLGGLRDFQNPNDYYDVYGPNNSLTLDGVIDLPNDILGVIQHFAPQGQAPYDVRFDRGPQTGANVWNMGPPDGVIDLPNDILGVIQQFGHNCV